MVTIKELEFHFKSSIDVIQFNRFILMCLHNFLQHIKNHRNETFPPQNPPFNAAGRRSCSQEGTCKSQTQFTFC